MTERPFKFALGQKVRLVGETGEATVDARTQFAKSENSYRLVFPFGRVLSLGESAIEPIG